MIFEHQKLRVADHLEQAATDIVNFILKSHKDLSTQNRHIADLASIMKEIEDEYNQPLLSWWSSLYRFYRQHTDKVEPLRQFNAITQEQFLILDVIADFLHKSMFHNHCENAVLLDLLLAKLNKYQLLEMDERFYPFEAHTQNAALMGIKLVLCNLFIQRAKAISEKSRHRNDVHFEIVK